MKIKQPTLRQLEYFACVAETLNFRQAADKLGISQPSLTAQITALEEMLQLTLFERSRAGTFLSPQGRVCLESARQVILSMRNFLDVSESAVRGPSMTFRIGVPPTLGPYLLPYLLPALHSQWADMKLYVREAATTELEEKLICGDFDLILMPLPVNSPDLSVEPLFFEPLKLVLPSDHALAEKASIAPQDIFQQKVLTLEGHHHFHRQVEHLCERFGALVQRDFEGTSLDTLRQMVVMGLGIAFLPGLYVHSELHYPDALKVFELEREPIHRLHALVWRNTTANPSFFRELACAIRELVQEFLSDVVTVTDSQDGPS